MQNFLRQLNAPQRAAATGGGHLLVLAGAGTGKTRVLTARIAWLLGEGGAAAANILAVTFTNKAAREMKERLAAMTPRHNAGLTLGTFHSVCLRLLRRHGEHVGLARDFQILDTDDQRLLVRRLLRELKANDEEFPPAEVRAYINSEKEDGRRPGDAPQGRGRRAAAFAEFFAKYEETRRQENKVDFPELLLAAYELLRDRQDLREHYATRFRHILVDEFQDTSLLQYKWLRLLVSDENQFFVVGDDNQSIYSFRSAHPENMNDFIRDFKLPSKNIVRLEENYRSTNRILAAANAVIAPNQRRLVKTLFSRVGEGEKISCIVAATDTEEATRVATDIRGAQFAGEKLAQIAVLYRVNAQSRLLEKKLSEAALPYRIYGGLRFYDRLEARHTLAYLRLAQGDDNDAARRVLNVPPRGIGAKSMAALEQAAQENVSPLEGNFAPSLMAAVEQSTNPKVQVFAALINRIRARKDAPLGELANFVIHESGLMAHYQSRPAERERAENLLEFANAAAEFAKSGGVEDDGEEEAAAEITPLSQFLANAALESGGDEQAPADAVNLMTLHAAKGLEFHRVFLVGVEENVLPAFRSIGEGNLEEERRLLYVGITRARRRLTLCRAQRRSLYGNLTINPPSRFLEDIPEEIFEPGDDVEEHAADTPVNESRGGQAWRKRKREKRGEAFRPSGSGETFSPRRAYGLAGGDQVRHAKFGSGLVIRIQNAGEEAEAIVYFKKAGTKTMRLALAKLEKVNK